MKHKFWAVLIALWVVASLFLYSCAPGMMKTGFVENYDEMRGRQPGESLPSFYYVKKDADLNQYKKILILDFYALTTEQNLMALKPGQGDFSNLQTQLADNLARYLQSNNVFEQCERVSKDISFDDMESIRQLEADAVLMSNIADFRTSSRGVSDQFEIKLIDVATGETVMIAIDNNSTEMHAVAMPLSFGRLLKLIAIGKGEEQIPAGAKGERCPGGSSLYCP